MHMHHTASHIITETPSAYHVAKFQKPELHSSLFILHPYTAGILSDAGRFPLMGWICIVTGNIR
jgi:hypothetical protein